MGGGVTVQGRTSSLPVTLRGQFLSLARGLHAGRKGVWRHVLSWRLDELEMVITYLTQRSQQPLNAARVQDEL